MEWTSPYIHRRWRHYAVPIPVINIQDARNSRLGTSSACLEISAHARSVDRIMQVGGLRSLALASSSLLHCIDTTFCSSSKYARRETFEELEPKGARSGNCVCMPNFPSQIPGLHCTKGWSPWHGSYHRLQPNGVSKLMCAIYCIAWAVYNKLQIT